MINCRWKQLKMDEERDLYEQERLTTDEKFLALESKIKGVFIIINSVYLFIFLHFCIEYEDLLSQGDNLSSSSSLSTIEERANWEKQLTDAEEECQSLRQRVTDLRRRLAQMERDHDEAVSKMNDEREHLVGRVRNLEKSFQKRQEEGEEQENFMKINNQLVSTVKIVGTPRPVSPIAKPAILPSGYSPLKSKGWARTCRSVPVSPGKCSGSSPEAHNKYQVSMRHLILYNFYSPSFFLSIDFLIWLFSRFFSGGGGGQGRAWFTFSSYGNIEFTWIKKKKEEEKIF